MKGPAAHKFLQDIVNVDQKGAQLIMAKITRNFKRGNERQEGMQVDRDASFTYNGGAERD